MKILLAMNLHIHPHIRRILLLPPPFVLVYRPTLNGGKYLSEGAAREWSTVVDISITHPSFKRVPWSSPRSPLSKTPKHVIF